MQQKGVDIDCSTSYLVTVNEAGYVFYTLYNEFPAWIFGLIVGVIALVVLIAIIFGIAKRRKYMENKERENLNSIIDSMLSS